jgi:hypothetical protein
LYIYDNYLTCQCVQFIYDRGGVGKAFGGRVHVSLGLWHNYKHANLLIYKFFARSFFAPLFHSIWPGVTFYATGKLTQISQIFTWLRMSYPSWKDALEEVVRDRETPRNSRGHARNIQLLMEFFTPTVCTKSSKCIC